MTKYVTKPVEDIPETKKKLLEPPQFDTVTKAHESQNVKQAYNIAL